MSQIVREENIEEKIRKSGGEPTAFSSKEVISDEALVK